MAYERLTSWLTIAASRGLAGAFREVNRIGSFPPSDLRTLRGTHSNPLFERHPALANRIPWVPLAQTPTPVEEMPGSSRIQLFVKRDDRTSSLYGGNKVRKLEFLLADAILAERRTLVTLGGLGSNHALATALHGARLGFEVDLVLYDQPVTSLVERNLGAFQSAGARLHYGGATGSAFLEARRLFERRLASGGKPYFIMVGGTSRAGCLGHVNAALELAGQVEEGLLPEPDALFVPVGTTGTAAGLIAGLRLAGLRTRVFGVRVADRVAANAAVLRFFAQDTLDYLRAHDPAIPEIRVDPDSFTLLPGYYGAGYGRTTPAADYAIEYARPHIDLEPTYTGKTFAACLDFCRNAGTRTVLFWNTYNSAQLESDLDLARLPAALQKALRVRQ